MAEMIKSLKTLMRVRQGAIDELKRQQAAIEGRRDGIIHKMEQLKAELEREIAAYEEMVDMRTFFGDFSESIKQRQGKLMKEVLRLEQRIQVLAQEIQGEYAELKKLEISHDRLVEEKKKAEEKKAQDELDELGAERHRRNVMEEELANA